MHAESNYCCLRTQGKSVNSSVMKSGNVQTDTWTASCGMQYLDVAVLLAEGDELCQAGIPQLVGICAGWLPIHPHLLQFAHPAGLQETCKTSSSIDSLSAQDQAADAPCGFVDTRLLTQVDVPANACVSSTRAHTEQILWTNSQPIQCLLQEKQICSCCTPSLFQPPSWP